MDDNELSRASRRKSVLYFRLLQRRHVTETFHSRRCAPTLQSEQEEWGEKIRFCKDFVLAQCEGLISRCRLLQRQCHHPARLQISVVHEISVRSQGLDPPQRTWQCARPLEASSASVIMSEDKKNNLHDDDNAGGRARPSGRLMLYSFPDTFSAMCNLCSTGPTNYPSRKRQLSRREGLPEHIRTR